MSLQAKIAILSGCLSAHKCLQSSPPSPAVPNPNFHSVKTFSDLLCGRKFRIVTHTLSSIRAAPALSKHQQYRRPNRVTIMSATELYMGYGGSDCLQSIGNVAINTMAHQGESAENDDYQDYLNDNDINARLIESQFGLKAAEDYRRSATIRRESNEREDRNQLATRAVLKAMFKPQAIVNAVVKFGRALCQKATRTPLSSSAASQMTSSLALPSPTERTPSSIPCRQLPLLSGSPLLGRSSSLAGSDDTLVLPSLQDGNGRSTGLSKFR